MLGWGDWLGGFMGELCGPGEGSGDVVIGIGIGEVIALDGRCCWPGEVTELKLPGLCCCRLGWGGTGPEGGWQPIYWGRCCSIMPGGCCC